MHILTLVTDNNPSWISRREENGRRNYFMINLHESMGLGRDRTRDPWICSQTHISSQAHYQLRNMARFFYVNYVYVMQNSPWLPLSCWIIRIYHIWASAWDFQQFDILTSVDSDNPLQPPFKLRNSKWYSVSSLTIIEYSSDWQRLRSDCAYAQADLRLCCLCIPHCWKSYALAHLLHRNKKVAAWILNQLLCIHL